MERLYVFALMWSVGALLELDDRRKMESWMRSNVQLDLPVIPPDSEDCIRMEEYVYPSDWTPEYGSILVPNVDNVRTDFLIQTIASQGKAVLLIGEQGTAKTVIIKAYMSRCNPETHVAKILNLSSATTPLMFQRHKAASH
ncbi:hypothetical protein CRUP_006010 [Coryphaenoides rupestris]|nr:hypothetical protein CRUP_006010 [Coryphaenoides rupestris]